MRHTFTSDDRTSGTWFTLGEDPPRVFCEWRWDTPDGTLHVRRDGRLKTWRPCPLNTDEAMRRVMENLPWIALNIGEHLGHDGT